VTKQPIQTAAILSSDDHCRRFARWLDRIPALSPGEILRRAVTAGLESDEEDYAKAASDAAMDLCTSNTIDTAETDLLGLAEHIASLAEILVWTVRLDSPWERPEPVNLSDRHPWVSGAHIGVSGEKLRHLAIVSKLDGATEMALRHSWEIQGECAAYRIPMDLIVVEVGSLRQGRWTCPWTCGWRHPVGKMLRFRKRDGDGFGANWDRVWRTGPNLDRDEWMDAMTEDGVLMDNLHVLSVDVPEMAGEIVELAKRKLDAMKGALPDPQFSRCFDKMRLCPFRGDCPNFKEPA
jgi:hypothetical protein